MTLQESKKDGIEALEKSFIETRDLINFFEVTISFLEASLPSLQGEEKDISKKEIKDLKRRCLRDIELLEALEVVIKLENPASKLLKESIEKERVKSLYSKYNSQTNSIETLNDLLKRRNLNDISEEDVIDLKEEIISIYNNLMDFLKEAYLHASGKSKDSIEKTIKITKDTHLARLNIIDYSINLIRSGKDASEFIKKVLRGLSQN